MIRRRHRRPTTNLARNRSRSRTCRTDRRICPRSGRWPRTPSEKTVVCWSTRCNPFYSSSYPGDYPKIHQKDKEDFGQAFTYDGQCPPQLRRLAADGPARTCGYQPRNSSRRDRRTLGKVFENPFAVTAQRGAIERVIRDRAFAVLVLQVLEIKTRKPGSSVSIGCCVDPLRPPPKADNPKAAAWRSILPFFRRSP
jgi:hypothetical protein